MFATIPDLGVYDHSHGDFHINSGGDFHIPAGACAIQPQPQSPSATWSVNAPPIRPSPTPLAAGAAPRTCG